MSNFSNWLYKVYTEKLTIQLPYKSCTCVATANSVFYNNNKYLELLGLKEGQSPEECIQTLASNLTQLNNAMDYLIDKCKTFNFNLNVNSNTPFSNIIETVLLNAAINLCLTEQYVNTTLSKLTNTQSLSRVIIILKTKCLVDTEIEYNNYVDFAKLGSVIDSDVSDSELLAFNTSTTASVCKALKTLAETVELISTKTEKEQSKSENQNDSSEKELLKKWREAEWVNIDPAINSLLDTLAKLYRSGIESLSQAGVLVDNGTTISPLVCVRCNKETTGQLSVTIENKADIGLIYDLGILKSLTANIDNLAPMKGIDPKTGFPTLGALYSNIGVMRDAHLAFQSANIVFSGRDHNKNSIKQWVKDTQLKDGATNADEWLKQNNGKGTKLTKWKYVAAWYKWTLENTLYRYFIEAGLSPDDISCLPKIQEIINLFAEKFKNVIAVAERDINKKQLQTTELRVCTDKPFDANLVAATIAKNLNTGNAKDITCTARVAENQVTTLRIIYDQEAANKSMVFASSIVQNLIDSDNLPTWGKVLLGRREDGTFLFWEDFMTGQTSSDRAYAIYAGSGSGKGNMTLTLIAAAISDQRQVFYTDGKPDSGASIAAEAWKMGQEAYMFDGQPQGGDLFTGILEANPVTNGMRDPEETLMYKAAIPKGIFQTDAAVREFLGVCRYLRSLSLCADILSARGGGNLKDGNWQVWVFDEMTNMSLHEHAIRRTFASYVSNQGYKFGQVKKDENGQSCLIGLKPCKELTEALTKGSDKYNEGIAYIADWLNWLVPISDKFNKLSTIDLRNADANIIFIFQNAEWLSNEKDGAITIIAQVVQLLKCRKFIGRNALAKACGDYGDGNTMRTEWANKIAGAGGWWAVSDAADIRAEGTKMTIFKPYSIWGYRKKDAKPEDAYKYLDYYIERLLNGRTPAGTVLQSAWDYAEQALDFLAGNNDKNIKTINPAKSLKDYMYNVARFSLSGAGFDPNTLSNKGSNSDFDDPDVTADYNKNITDGDNFIEPDINTEQSLPNDLQHTLENLQNQGQASPEEIQNMLNNLQNQGQASSADIQTKLEALQNFQTQIQTQTKGQEHQFDALKRLAELEKQGQEQGEVTLRKEELTELLNSYKNLSQISQEEATKIDPICAYDTSRIIKLSKDGTAYIDDTQIPKGYLKPLAQGLNGNYVSFNYPIINDNIFKTNNHKKIDNQLTLAWHKFIQRLIKEFGGKGAIRNLQIDDNNIIVNGKFIDHGFLNSNYITSLSNVADLVYMFDHLTGLTQVALSSNLLDLLDEQFDDRIIETSVKTGKEINIYEYMFKHYINLNEIIDISSNKALRKKDLLNEKEERKKLINDLIAENKKRKEARKGIFRLRDEYLEKHKKDYPASERYARRKKSKKKVNIIRRGLASITDFLSR